MKKPAVRFPDLRRAVLAAAAALAAQGARAQTSQAWASGSVSVSLPAPANPAPLWTPSQLDQLLAPVALYPDPLLAMILPASTEPADVVAASEFLAAGGNPAAAAGRGWDESVAALAHFPVVVEWMAQNIEWTTQLGEAYLGQPGDVAESIQRLRARARAAGTLVDTPQQIVVVDGDDIEIEPAGPDVIYVPTYDPLIVFGAPPYGFAGPFLTFGAGFPAGPWLTYGWDWRRDSIWVGNWRGGPAVGELDHPPNAHRWQPPDGGVRPYAFPGSPAPGRPAGAPIPGRPFPRPEPIRGAAGPAPGYARPAPPGYRPEKPSGRDAGPRAPSRAPEAPGDEKDR